MLRYYFMLAIHGSRRAPWLALLMILTLAAGIAAGMITITLRHALGMDPAPDKSNRLLSLQNPDISYSMGGKFSYAESATLRRIGDPEVQSVASGAGITSIAGADGSDRIDGVGVRYVTAGFFAMFGVPLKGGRTWTVGEEQAGTPVALLSAGVASHYFPTGRALGKRLYVGDTLFTVIGVVGAWNPQPRYYDLGGAAGAFGGGGDGVFAPVTTIQYAPAGLMMSRTCPGRLSTLPEPAGLLSSRCKWLMVWYLLQDREGVGAFKGLVRSHLSRLFPKARADDLQLLNVREVLASADIVPGSVRLYAWLGLGFLALCVANASGMQLSRVLRGTSQIGVRRALGASRAEIIKQYLCDALLVGGAGGLLGAGLTFGGLYAVRQLPGVVYADMARMDASMFGMMILLVLVCSLLVGMIPAWIASRADPALVIKVPQ